MVGTDRSHTPSSDSVAVQLEEIESGKSLANALLDAWLHGYKTGALNDGLWLRAYEPPVYPRLSPYSHGYLEQATLIRQEAMRRVSA